MSRSIPLLVFLWVACTNCVHTIQVSPLPAEPSPTSIPRSLQLVTSPPALEGADHRPGITLLKWPESDLHRAIVNYLQQRSTFTSVSDNPSDLTLRVTTKLFLSSRQGLYHYRIVLQGEMSGREQTIKEYHAEHRVTGSSVRWVTASDRVPIETALRVALENLTGQIERDRSLYMTQTDRLGL